MELFKPLKKKDILSFIYKEKYVFIKYISIINNESLFLIAQQVRCADTKKK